MNLNIISKERHKKGKTSPKCLKNNVKPTRHTFWRHLGLGKTLPIHWHGFCFGRCVCRDALLRKSSATSTSVIPRRHLLMGRTGNHELNMTQVREQLVELVGASKEWSESGAPTFAAVAGSQLELPTRQMSDSYQEACIPLGSEPMLRNKYINFYNTVRFGRISEDLDTMAVWISYTHNLGRNPTEKCQYSIVTALVDSINLNTVALQPDKDLLLRGHVSWVGSTSIEVSMDVDQQVNGTWEKMLDAKFLMVARNPQTKGKAFVCPLEVKSEEEKALFDEGEAHKAKRQKECQESLLRTPPTASERLVIHDLFLKTLDSSAATFKRPVKPEGAVWMERSLLKNVHICFPEQRNLYNKIFGGFLMRQAFEVGWANACLYCQARPVAVAVDDIMFRKPVEVGSLLFLSSQVVYTEGPYMQMKVHAEVVKPKTGQHDTTNIFYYTFKSLVGDVPVVMPKSYSEYMMYVDGKRHFDSGRSKLV